MSQQGGVSSGGRRFRSQASQGNPRPSGSNVAQGGTSFGRATIEQRTAIRTSPLLNDNNASLSRVNEIRANNEGLSKTDIARRNASAESIQRKSISLRQKAIAKQAQIKVNQISKKNTKILQEIQEIDRARETLRLANVSQEQKARLRANFEQKEKELRADLNRNQNQQIKLIGGFESQVIAAGIEDDQRKSLQQSNAKSKSPVQVTRSGSTIPISQSSFFIGPRRPTDNGSIALAALQSTFGFRRDTSLRDAEVTNKGKVTKKPKSDIDKFFEGFAAPISNVKTQGEDFFGALASGNLQSQPLGTHGNILGLPVAKNQRPLKETASSQIFSGKAPDLKNPAILGSAVSEGLLIAAPVAGAKAAPKVSSGIKTTTQKQQVKKLAKQRESEGVFGIEKLNDDVFAITRGTEGRSSTPTSKIQSSLEIFNLGNRKKSAQFTDVPKQVKIPKGNGGPSDIPITIVRFGQRSRFGKKDPEVIDVKPTRKPVNNPDEIIATGDIDDIVAGSVGLKRTSKGSFAGKPGPEQRQSIRDAEQFGKITTIAEGSSAPLSKVRSGSIFDFVGQQAVKTKVVASKANQFGQRKGTVGGPAGRGGIDVGSKSFDKELSRLGLSPKEPKGRGSSVFSKGSTSLGDDLTDDIISGNTRLTTQQKQQIKQSFGGGSSSKSSKKTTTSRSPIGVIPISSQVEQVSILQGPSQKKPTKSRPSTLETISEIPISGGLFDLRSDVKPKRDQLGVLPKSEVKQDQGLDLGFIQEGTFKQTPSTENIPIFRTGSRGVSLTRKDQALDNIFPIPPRTPTESIFFPPTPPRKEQLPRTPIFGGVRSPFPGFGEGGFVDDIFSRGGAVFELNTELNPISPFGGAVKGFGGIIRTRTDKELELVDEIFVSQAKKQGKKKKGFEFAGFDILSGDEGINLFPNTNGKGKGKRKKKSKGIFDLF